MKAFVLAAGLGTRLRPLTDHVPKCLVPVGGRPLLDLWLDGLHDAGIDDVLVNVHHMADRVRAHLAGRRGAPRVRVSHEPTLLGSAGTLVANREFVGSDEIFLVVNGDNLTDFDVRALVSALEGAPEAEAAIAVFHAPRPEACGILEVTGGVVTSFEEKPSAPRSDLANAGMYAFRRSVLDLVPVRTPVDIGTDLLPLLVDRAVAVPIGTAFLLDIGTPEALSRAEAEWPDRGVA
ncbi:nucleotidyltransferase family protein [Knoellia aerolata]|uniref:Nucleotidyl transferase n=1 Tax=Knoellia aerolata DSM 18566 TaxID=1385519 RepID=A0A0A0JX24_9MICO|nr:nucleotidyltransferase family protein [Knoellia aerolata]KGN40607.1 nucleotidyl transferase [Knoellia aerolata DSM 18566]